MAIRARLKKLKKLEYHKKYGSLSNPPFVKGAWPRKSAVKFDGIKSLKDKNVILGWIIKRDESPGDYGKYGVWVTTDLGWEVNDKAVGLDPAKDFRYIGEHVGYTTALQTLVDEFESEHNIELPIGADHKDDLGYWGLYLITGHAAHDAEEIARQRFVGGFSNTNDATMWHLWGQHKRGVLKWR